MKLLYESSTGWVQSGYRVGTGWVQSGTLEPKLKEKEQEIRKNSLTSHKIFDRMQLQN